MSERSEMVAEAIRPLAVAGDPYAARWSVKIALADDPEWCGEWRRPGGDVDEENG